MRLIFILVLLPFIASAQPYTNLSNKSFNLNNYQFSSIVIYNDEIILPAEKCNSLVYLKLDGNFIREEPIGVKDAQIEGAALYKDLLFLLDETVANKNVYVFDLKTKKIVSTIKLSEIAYSNDDFGIEGIAINAGKKICYILQERKDARHSVIYQYSFDDTDGKPVALSYKSSHTLQIQDVAGDYEPAFRKQRYTDILYVDNCLYLLGTNFREPTFIANQYFIDRICDVDNLATNSAIITIGHVFIDLSRLMRNFFYSDGKDDKYYSTNLEGLTLYKDEFYLVTDNQGGPADCKAQADLKTLLLKIKKPGW